MRAIIVCLVAVVLVAGCKEDGRSDASNEAYKKAMNLGVKKVRTLEEIRAEREAKEKEGKK